MPSPGAGADSDDPLNEMHLRNIASDALAEVAGGGGGGGGGSTQDLSRDLDALTLASADSGKASRLETATSKRAGEAPQDLAPKLAPELNVEGWYGSSVQNTRPFWPASRSLQGQLAEAGRL